MKYCKNCWKKTTICLIFPNNCWH